MDITQPVVTGIDGKLTQFAFEREHLDQPGVSTSAGGAPPIVQTPGPAPRATTPAKK
jgi:hypothetical protein